MLVSKEGNVYLIMNFTNNMYVSIMPLLTSI